MPAMSVTRKRKSHFFRLSTSIWSLWTTFGECFALQFGRILLRLLPFHPFARRLSEYDRLDSLHLQNSHSWQYYRCRQILSTT